MFKIRKVEIFDGYFKFESLVDLPEKIGESYLGVPQYNAGIVRISGMDELINCLKYQNKGLIYVDGKLLYYFWQNSKDLLSIFISPQ